MPRKNSKPAIGRSEYAQDQKHQVMKDRRTKRVRTRQAKKQQALREYA